ncbi:DUF305 domain-containing protein [Agromyces silvae]|uniref:DUF305 domain-containing protein n=1 Tax=Agromyces silvae TaxID=3388266 RepID=UPI00280ACBFD|nr:DUF305 domain-containing protein [Agromyces protaetiae]
MTVVGRGSHRVAERIGITNAGERTETARADARTPPPGLDTRAPSFATRPARWRTAVVALVLALGGCTAGGGAGEASGPPEASAPPIAAEAVTEADAEWMAGMAEHHDQAVALARLAEGRAEDPEVLASAERIATAQAAEAAALRTWLDRRGLGGHDTDHDAGGMPGEISATTFSRAEAATGAAFDRIFLDAMIRHHEGAVQMSEDRLAGAGDPAVSRWARTVAAGQSIEIDRLRGIAARLPVE